MDCVNVNHWVEYDQTSGREECHSWEEWGGGIWRRGVALEVAFNFPFSCHCSPCSPFHHLSPSCLGCHCFPSGPLYTRELATPGLIQPLAHRRPEFIWERDLIASNWPTPASNTIVNDTEHYDELFCVNWCRLNLIIGSTLLYTNSSFFHLMKALFTFLYFLIKFFPEGSLEGEEGRKEVREKGREGKRKGRRQRERNLELYKFINCGSDSMRQESLEAHGNFSKYIWKTDINSSIL